jgi:hypothetical protein
MQWTEEDIGLRLWFGTILYGNTWTNYCSHVPCRRKEQLLYYTLPFVLRYLSWSEFGARGRRNDGFPTLFDEDVGHYGKISEFSMQSRSGEPNSSSHHPSASFCIFVKFERIRPVCCESPRRRTWRIYNILCSRVTYDAFSNNQHTFEYHISSLIPDNIVRRKQVNKDLLTMHIKRHLSYWFDNKSWLAFVLMFTFMKVLYVSNAKYFPTSLWANK